MKGFRCLVVVLFSLLIVFAGAGVAVIHCYCVSCRVTHECCDAEHPSHHHHTAGISTDIAQQEECCTATVYKIDLLKGTEQMPNVLPHTQYLSHLSTRLFIPLPVERLHVFILKDAPPPPDARQYQALYSTFLI